MTHKRSCSLTAGFVFLAVVATLGTADTASSPRSSTARANDAQLAQASRCTTTTTIRWSRWSVPAAISLATAVSASTVFKTRAQRTASLCR